MRALVETNSVTMAPGSQWKPRNRRWRLRIVRAPARVADHVGQIVEHLGGGVEHHAVLWAGMPRRCCSQSSPPDRRRTLFSSITNLPLLAAWSDRSMMAFTPSKSYAARRVTRYMGNCGCVKRVVLLSEKRIGKRALHRMRPAAFHIEIEQRQFAIDRGLIAVHPAGAADSQRDAHGGDDVQHLLDESAPCAGIRRWARRPARCTGRAKCLLLGRRECGRYSFPGWSGGARNNRRCCARARSCR